MKNTNIEKALIKYGILPSLTSETQLSEFEGYASEASEGHLESFVKFAEICEEKLNTPSLRLAEITDEAKQAMKRAADILEKLSPPITESILSAFSETKDIKKIKSDFFNSVKALSKEGAELVRLEGEYAELTKPRDFKLMTELRLRLAALCEYSDGNELTERYDLLLKEAKKSYSKATQNKHFKKWIILKDASGEIAKFIIECHCTVESIEERRLAHSNFDMLIRQYQRSIHDIMLKI